MLAQKINPFTSIFKDSVEIICYLPKYFQNFVSHFLQHLSIVLIIFQNQEYSLVVSLQGLK